MKFERMLATRNLRRHPVRTAALMLLSAFLCMSVFAGSVIISSLRNGLDSYRDRLGADVVVVPYQARTKGTFESILLQGIPGTFYMDEQYFQKVKTIEGVEAAAPQCYLASASAGCCSVPVQIIGFDPEADFTVQPWIRRSYSGTLGDGDIIVGSRINVPGDRQLTFYNTDCRIVAQLDETGTGLDTAVYANMDTIREMSERSQALGFNTFAGVEPGRMVSSVMVKVAEGYEPADVAGEINLRVRHVEASQAASMVSGIADGLRNVSRIIGILIVMIWLLAIVILMIAFFMISHERAKEFAVLRVMGASRGMLSGLLLWEAVLLSLSGAAIGLLLSALIVLPFGNLLSEALSLPYLLPEAPVIVLFGAGAMLLSVLAGSLTSALSAMQVSRGDAGLSLRESV